MNKLRLIFSSAWRPALYWGAALAAIACVYLWRINSLTRGGTEAEITRVSSVVSNNIHIIDIIRDASFAPYQVILWAVQLLPNATLGGVRAISVLIAVAAIVATFYIVRRWYSFRLALLISTLFATSAWMLHTGRYADATILYVLPLIAAALIGRLHAKPRSPVIFILTVVVIVSCVYVPGMLAILVALAIIERARISRWFRAAPIQVAIAGWMLTAILIAPLVISIVWPANGSSSLGFIQTLLGIPSSWIGASEALKNIASVPTSLFLHAATDLPAWTRTGTMPLLDAYIAALFVIGLYASIRSFSLLRSRALVLYVAYTWLLISLGGVSIIMLLPAVYLLAGIGAAYLLQQWLEVFPKNPVAHVVGFSTITVVAILSIGYNLFQYFVAWPSTVDVLSEFTKYI